VKEGFYKRWKKRLLEMNKQKIILIPCKKIVRKANVLLSLLKKPETEFLKKKIKKK